MGKAAIGLYIALLLSLMQDVASVTRNKKDKSITIMPEKPYFSLIWLHGLGDSS
jgi:phospholipase/carboxylesterase